MSLQVNVLRWIAITCVVFVSILFLPLFMPISEEISNASIELLKFPLPSFLFLGIFLAVFIGIGSLTTFKNAGWIPFVLFIQELYFIYHYYNGVEQTGGNAIVDSFELWPIVGFICIIFIECSSRLEAISKMAEMIPVYQESSDKLDNYIAKVSATFPNAVQKLNASNERYKHSPSIDYLTMSFFAIALSFSIFYMISQIGGRRYPYIIIGLLLPIIVLALSLQMVKREDETVVPKPRIVKSMEYRREYEGIASKE